MPDEPKPRTRKELGRPPLPPPDARLARPGRTLAGRTSRAIIRSHRAFLRRLGKRASEAPFPVKAQLPGDDLMARAAIREHVTTVLLMIPAVTTGVLTYSGAVDGMAESGATLMKKGEAALFATTIATFSFLGSYKAFGLLDRLHGRFLAAGTAASLLFTTAICAVDATLNLLALGGDSASQISLSDTADHYARQRSEVFARAAAIRQILPGIRAQSQRFLAAHEHERKTGAMSGAPGPGKVEGSFFQVGKLLGDLANDAEKGLAEAERLQGQLTTELGTMKAQVYVQAPLRVRIEAVSRSGDKLDDLLSRLAQFDFSTSVRVTLKSLETFLPAPTMAKNPFEARQNEAVAQVAAMAKPVATALSEGLAGLGKSASAPAATPPRPLRAHDAIWVYWRSLLPQVVAATLTSFAPLLLLVMLLAARREAEHLNRQHGARI